MASLKDIRGRIASVKNIRKITRAMEMVAALAVSVGLGLWLDSELGVAPLFLIILLVMGMAAGVLNVYRAVSGFTHGQLLQKQDNGKNDDA